MTLGISSESGRSCTGDCVSRISNNRWPAEVARAYAFTIHAVMRTGMDRICM